MKIKKIYVCENSIEGIFTGVYDAWSAKNGHENNKILVKDNEVSEYNLELFSDYIYVKTDFEKAIKVAKSIKNKISEEAFNMVSCAAWSDSQLKGDLIYRFLILGFSVGASIVNYLGNDTVMNIFELNRSVENEAHHFLGFLRFSENKDNILLAKIKPKNDILRLLAPHFTDRLPQENFVIYDEKRKTAIIHKAGFSWVYSTIDAIDINKFYEISEKEEELQTLWKTFFNTISIKDRTNKKLQQNNLPVHFRGNMTEFK